jgi:hypothetical protein
MTEAPMDDDGLLPTYANAVDTPPGWFKLKLVRGGPEVPAKVWRIEERDEVGDLMADVEYRAEIDGEAVDVLNPPRWPWMRIDRAEWQFLTDTAAWARANDPDHPAAQPRRPRSHSERTFY